jgi:hypothetical protein
VEEGQYVALARELHRTLNAPFLEPGRKMDQQIVNKTSDRREHSPRQTIPAAMRYRFRVSQLEVSRVGRSLQASASTLYVPSDDRHLPGSIAPMMVKKGGTDVPVRCLDEDGNFPIHAQIAGDCMSQTPLRQQDRLLSRTSAACAPSTVAANRSKKRWPA